MKQILIVCALIAAFLLSSCADDSEQGAFVANIRGDSELSLYIDITAETAYSFIALLAENPRVSTITITSSGGDVASALRMAEAIIEQGIDINVADFCFSSCANIIVAAAKTVNVLENSLVCIHGSSESSLRFPLNILLARLIRRESEFFEGLGIDTGLFSSLDNVPEGYDWYCPNKDTLEKFGYSNIARYWYPASQADAERVAELASQRRRGASEASGTSGAIGVPRIVSDYLWSAQ